MCIRNSIVLFLTALVFASSLNAVETDLKRDAVKSETKTEDNPTFFFSLDDDSYFSKRAGEIIDLYNGDLKIKNEIDVLKGPGDLSFQLVESFSSKNSFRMHQQYFEDSNFPLLGFCYGFGWDYAPAVLVTYPTSVQPPLPIPATYLRMGNGGWQKYETFGIEPGHQFPIDGVSKTQMTYISSSEGYVLRFRDGTKYYFNIPEGFTLEQCKGVHLLNRIVTPQGHEIRLSYYHFPGSTYPGNLDYYSGIFGLKSIGFEYDVESFYGYWFHYTSGGLSTITKQIGNLGNPITKTIRSSIGCGYCSPVIKYDAIGNKTTYVFNQNSALEYIVAPTGNTRYFEYSLPLQAEPFDYYVSRRYEVSSEQIRIKDYSFVYDLQGQFASIINNNNYQDTVGCGFWGPGKIMSRANSITREGVLYLRDAVGNIISSHRVYNLESIFLGGSYNEFSVSHYTYDNNIAPDATNWGLVTKYEGPSGEKKEFTYDGSDHYHKVESVKTWLDETNYAMQYFDIDANNGNVKSSLVKYGIGDPSVPTNDGDDFFTQINYTSSGNIRNVIDPNLGRKGLAYDDNDIFITSDSTLVSNDPLVKLTTTMVRDQLTGLVETKTDPNNKTYIYTYDDLNRPLTQTNPDASQRTMQYHDPEPLGDKMIRITTTDEDGKVTKQLFDELGRVRQVKTIDINWERSIVVDYQYDCESRLWKVSDPWTDLEPANYDLIVPVPANVKYIEYFYDQIGRKTRIKRQDGSNIYYSYTYGTKPGLEGTFYIISITDPKGYVSKKYIDKSGRLKAVEDPAGALNVNCYDRAGRLTSVTNPKNETTSFTYDVAGRRIGAYYPDGNHAEFQYDNNGNLRFKLKPNKFASNADYLEYRYDLANRLTEYGTKNTSGTYTKKVGFKFTGVYLDSVTDPSGWQAYQYNNRGFVTKYNRKLTQLGKTYSIRYDYSPAGTITGMLYPSGYYAKYDRDGHGRLTELSGGNDNCMLSNYSYNDKSQLSQRSFTNGITQTLTYNDLGYLATDLILRGQDQLFGHEYNYDPNGNLTVDACPDMPSSDNDYEFAEYQYDNTDRLVYENYYGGPINYNQTYQYNGADERTATNKNGQSSSYVYGLAGKLNQVTGASPMTFGYDANGNTITIATATGTATLGYDYLDRLTSWSKSDTAITYGYDALGHKIYRQKTTGIIIEEEKDAIKNGLKPATVDGTMDGETVSTPEQNLDVLPVTVKSYYLWDLNGKLICDLDQYGKYLKSYYYDSRGRLAEYKTINQNVVDNWGFELGNVQYPETPWYMWAPDNQTPNCNWTMTSDSRTGLYALHAGPFSATTHETYAQNIGTLTAPLNASCYVKGQDLTGGARLVVECWASNYTVFKGSFTSSTLTGTFGWTQVNLPINSLPIGTQTLKVTLQRLNGGGYVWFDDVRCEKGSVRKADSLYYYHGDRLRTIRLLTDGSGNVTWHQSTTAFGENLSNMLGNKYKFTGMEIEDNGLYDFNARYYMPQIGRFISSDPIRPTINYIYSLQNPTKYIDPTGFYDEDGDWETRDVDPDYNYQVDTWYYYNDGPGGSDINAIYWMEGVTVEETIEPDKLEEEYYPQGNIDADYGNSMYDEGIGLEYEKIIGEGVTWETPSGRIRVEEYSSVSPNEDRQITFSQDPLEVQVGPFYLNSEPLSMGRIGVEIPVMDFNFMGMQFEYGINVEYEATMLEAAIGLGTVGACILGGEGFVIVPMLEGAYAR